MEENKTDAQRIMDLELRIMELEKRMKEMEETTGSTGAYLQGVPEYARKYYEDRKAKIATGGK